MVQYDASNNTKVLWGFDEFASVMFFSFAKLVVARLWGIGNLYVFRLAVVRVIVCVSTTALCLWYHKWHSRCVL